MMKDGKALSTSFAKSDPVAGFLAMETPIPAPSYPPAASSGCFAAPQICQCVELLPCENGHCVSNTAPHRKDLMQVVGVAGKGQHKPPARLDPQLRLLEKDFATVEFVIELTDRR
jgi:hypothetical protein